MVLEIFLTVGQRLRGRQKGGISEARDRYGLNVFMYHSNVISKSLNFDTVRWYTEVPSVPQFSSELTPS